MAEESINNLNARKFLVWLVMGASFMLVAGLTSIFLITTPASSDIHTRLPYVFIASTLIILGSSYTLHIANTKLKQLQFGSFRQYIKYTIGLGVLFIILQAVAWMQMIGQQQFFDSHKTYVSFIYVFVFVHFLHIITGIGLLIYTLNGSVKNRPNYRITFRTEASTLFWHFIDLLWIYLYIFLLIK
jgi:cytochrome c oxidase subunit 3|eukprot:gene5008-5056_t